MSSLLCLQPHRRVLVLAALIAACTVVGAQGFGPEMYGIVGRFGMSSPVTTRLLAMGGILSCVNDRQFANPAFAASQPAAAAGLRSTWTDFDNGPTVRSQLVNVALPLHPNRDGLHFTLMDLDSGGDFAMLPMVGPVDVNMEEDALVVDYGRRLSGRLTAGLSVLGFERIDLNFVSPFGPVLMTLEDKADWGARVGGAYEWAPGDFIGGLFSFSRDRVDVNGAAVMPGSADFDSDQLAVGVSGHLGPRVLVAAEFQRGKSSTDGFDRASNTWHFGMESRIGSSWAVRSGLSDGNASFGVGVDDGSWRIDYAFIRNWNDDDVRPLFGGSETHSLQIIHEWD